MKKSNENSVEIVEVVETLEQKIARIKAEQKAELDRLLAEQKALKEKVKELKLQEVAAKAEMKEKAAKERSEKLAEMLKNGSFEVKVNKTQIVKEYMLKGYDKEMIKEATGYDNKFLLDTMWRIEKAAGLR